MPTEDALRMLVSRARSRYNTGPSPHVWGPGKMGEEFSRIAGLFAGPVVAILALLAPVQTLWTLSLLALLPITAVATLIWASIAAQRLADLSSAPKPGVGFAIGNPPPVPRHRPWVCLVLLLAICAGGAAVAGAEVRFLALRTVFQTIDGKPVTTFYAPVRPVADATVRLQGADFSRCRAINRSGPGASPLNLLPVAPVDGDPRASIKVSNFVSPQAFALDCGSPSTYLPLDVGSSGVLVLNEDDLSKSYLGIILVGGLIWIGSALRWRSRRR
jgi:hypothetical protein